MKDWNLLNNMQAKIKRITGKILTAINQYKKIKKIKKKKCRKFSAFPFL